MLPLAAEFGFGGATLFVIAVHFDDKTTDSPRYGAIQPPLLASAAALSIVIVSVLSMMRVLPWQRRPG